MNMIVSKIELYRGKNMIKASVNIYRINVAMIALISMTINARYV